MTSLSELLPAASKEAEATSNAPWGELVEGLTKTFARVLGVSPVSADSDFFELGGDSILAMALALEIQGACGIDVPATLVFDAPTPALLARGVAERARSKAGPLLLLKEGHQEPPVFLVPGVTGSPLEFTAFAKAVDIPNPIYGLQARGLDGREPPLHDIKEMAAYFIPAIRERQPHGPYLLGGHSMGGLTALELGGALAGAGERVALLAIFDTMIPRRQLPLAQRFAVWRQRARYHAAAAGKRPLRHAASRMAKRKRPSSVEPLPNVRASAALRAIQGVDAAAREALRNYRPRRFPGTLTFFTGTDLANWPIYPEITWRPLAKTLEMRRIGEGHKSLFQAYAEETAAEFVRVVNSALEAT